MTCRCGHGADAHEHYRAGSDCGVCGPKLCRAYRRAPANVERKIFGPLRTISTEWSRNLLWHGIKGYAVGPSYAPVLRTAPWWEKLRKIRGIWFATPIKVTFVYVNAGHYWAGRWRR